MQSQADTLKALQSIISIRGNKLVLRWHLRREPCVWVAKSGTDPRAWSRPDSKTHYSSKSGWIPARMPLDELLIHPAHLRKQISQWKADLIENRRLRQFGDDPQGWAKQEARFEIRTLIKTQEMIDKHRWELENLFKDNADHRTPLSSKLQSILEKRRDSSIAIERRIKGLREKYYGHRIFNKDAWVHWCRLSSAKSNTCVLPASASNYSIQHPAYPQTNNYLRIQNELIKRIRKAQALLKWLEYFPEGSLDFTRDRRLRQRRWHLMNLWIRVPGSRDLFQDCPPLAFMLASCWVFRGKHDKNQFRAMRSLVMGKRSKILDWLSFPSAKNVIPLLRKLHYRCVSCKELQLLRYLIRSKPEVTTWLLECDTPIHSGNLLFLRSFSVQVMIPPDTPFLTPSLGMFRNFMKKGLPAPDSDGRHHRNNHLFADCLRMIKQMPQKQASVSALRLSRIQSPRKLHEFHDKLVNDPVHVAACVNGMLQMEKGELADNFPVTLPFNQTPSGWNPLTTLEEIAKESFELCHCLYAAYRKEIAEGNYFAYSVTTQSGVRATLGLRKNSHDQWSFDQLQGRRNNPVPSPDEQQVLHTLSSLSHHALPPTTTNDLSSPPPTEDFQVLHTLSSLSHNALPLTNTNDSSSPLLQKTFSGNGKPKLYHIHQKTL